MPEERSEWNLRCHNDYVNKDDSWALAHAKGNGTDCSGERGLSWYQFPPCGKAGKLWERRNT